jgi:hypothetical protein
MVLETGERPPQSRDHVEERHVVIAGNNNFGGFDPFEKSACRGKFMMPSALR